VTAGPLVSIGLPTYNRAAKLERAMEFVLAQDYQNIEVVISDNASPDNTPEVCERLCKRDSRIRYIRQATNLGPTANYMAVLEAARGDMYMALADDDWIDPNYVAACVGSLLDSPDFVLACGQAQMYRGGAFSHRAATTTLLDESPADRVVRYYATVVENGAFHGVVRRETLMRLPRMTNVLGGDWMWMASVAFQGKIKTLQTTEIKKHMGGASVGWNDIIRVLRLPAWQARYWAETILVLVFKDIAWQSPVYTSLGPAARLALAGRVTLALGAKWQVPRRWRGLAKDLVLGRAS
jgi:glycosyltransferase involved in cell wall biosynthesis